MSGQKLKRYYDFSLGEKNRMNGVCKLCNHNYKDMNGIYSNFLKHLKRKHASEYQQTFAPRDNDDDDDSSDIMNSTQDEQPLSSDATQMATKQNRISLSIAKNLIIKCNLPLCILENPAFRDFIKELYPKWQPISTRKLKADIITAFRTRIHKTICEALDKVHDLTLTIDAWSDRRGRGFLGVTCHFIDDNMIPQAFLIDFVRMKSPHTSETIQRLTEYVLDRFNIKNKVYRIITDNASSMIKAYKFGLAAAEGDESNHDDHAIVLQNDRKLLVIRFLLNGENNDLLLEGFNPANFQIVSTLQEDALTDYAATASKRISCFAHTLQLTVRDGLHKNTFVSNILEKCEAFARLTHKSTKIADLLDTINKHIERPNMTRWSSEFMLIKSILSIDKNDIQSISSLLDNVIQFSSSDLTTMTEIVNILEPFHQISVKCQGEKMVTISLVLPSIVHLICHLSSIDENLTVCKRLARQLQSSIEQRFSGIIHRLYQMDIGKDDPFNDPLYFMATVLDPAFKFFWIRDLKLPANVENRLKQNMIQLILDEISSSHEREHSTEKSTFETGSSAIQIDASSSVTNRVKRIKLFVYDDYQYASGNSQRSTELDPSVELDAYLNDPVRSSFSDYWQRSQFTSLKNLATRIFSVQASSAPVERVFSQAGLILSSRRTRMNEQLFKDIVFLKANRSLL